MAVLLETTLGDVVIDLYTEERPRGESQVLRALAGRRKCACACVCLQLASAVVLLEGLWLVGVGEVACVGDAPSFRPPAVLSLLLRGKKN